MSRILGKKVYVGLSGGVDSSVSAALLKKAGYDVTGVFIKVWQPDWIYCTWKEDRLDAMRVCAVLNIPFREVNLEEEYKRRVIDYMISEYQAGRTPNPDVFCNTFVKFGAFYDWARKEGADFVATGHYAQIKPVKDQRLRIKDCGLFAGVDTEKDQSYFLWGLKKEQLPHILFPVGGLRKTETRKLAKQFKLPTAEKKDSQGLCFLGKIDVKDFLRHYIAPRPGKVLNEKGDVVGTHDGALFFTIGERHGFFVQDKTTAQKPLYVIRKDPEANTVTVSRRPPILESGKTVNLSNINIIGDLKGTISARTRYRAPLVSCTVKETKTGFTAKFNSPVHALTPGQSLVLYRGQECLGGGVIFKEERPKKVHY